MDTKIKGLYILYEDKLHKIGITRKNNYTRTKVLSTLEKYEREKKLYRINLCL